MKRGTDEGPEAAKRACAAGGVSAAEQSFVPPKPYRDGNQSSLPRGFLNDRMHPRNRYKNQPPDFKQLAEQASNGLTALLLI